MAQQIAQFVANLATSYGTGLTAVAYYGTYALVSVGISYGLNALTRGEISKPDSFAVPKKQPIAPRQYAYGRNRLSGPYMLWEAAKGRLFDIIDLHDGRVEAFEQWWLNDDKVTLDAVGADFGAVIDTDAGDNRYGANDTTPRVFIYSRLGLATETSFTADRDFSELPDGTWTELHRGDGIASCFMYCRAVEQNNMANAFPNGGPIVSVTTLCTLVHDWRDEAEDPEDDSTWQARFNGVVQLADYLTSGHHGMGFDYATRIAPNLAEWTQAADDCDDPVALKAGGFEPRYESHGPWTSETPPAEVLGRLLESFDGWLSQRGDGSFSVQAGVYREPEVVFTDDEVREYTVQRFVEDEQRVDGLVVSYLSPDHEFRAVETDPWGDPESDRLDPFSPLWVQSNGQARRLAKRRFSRMAADVRGTFTTDLYGLRALGDRYVRLQISEVEVISDVVVEITNAELDVMEMQVVFTFILADENIDAWNPTTEEGDGPSLEDRTPAEILLAPTIEDVEAFFQSTGEGGEGVRLRIDTTGPERDDLTWFVGWRVASGVSWNEAGYSDVDPDAAVVLETGFVTSADTIEIRTAYMTGSGALSPWSDIFEASTVPEEPAGRFDFSDADNSALLILGL